LKPVSHYGTDIRGPGASRQCRHTVVSCRTSQMETRHGQTVNPSYLDTVYNRDINFSIRLDKRSRGRLY